MKENRMLKNISIVMIYSLGAKFLSFLVELLVASKYGATTETDVYYMVYGITQIIYPMISIGIWKVYLPEYKTRLVQGKEAEAKEITNQLLIIFLTAASLVITFCFCFPKALLFIFAPGFDAGSVKTAVVFLRIVVFMFFFNTITTFASAVLQSNNCFSKSQLKEVIQHLPQLIYLLFFSYKYGIWGLCLAFTTGTVFTAAVECFLSKKYYSFRFPKKIADRSTLSILRQVPVACVNSVINQLNNIIDKAFASGLATGSITYLNYGGRLIHLFDGIFSTAVSTAFFPHITEMVAKNEKEKLKDFLKHYIIIISAFLLPISALIVLYSRQIVSIVFGHGQFDDYSVIKTASVLLMYGIGLLLMSMTTVVNDVFYVLKKTRILLATTAINIVSNIILDFIFVKSLSVAGLSLATTISLFISLLLKLFLIKDVIRIDTELRKHIILNVAACGIAAVIARAAGSLAAGNIWSFILGCTVFVLAYSLFLLLATDYYRVRLRKICMKLKKTKEN